MIHYALRCGGGHEFDGWFRSSAAFDTQAAQGLLDCPVCADRRVERALMAPNVRASRTRAEPPPQDTAPAAALPAPAPPTPPMPAELRAVLQRLRAEVEKNCEHVGPRFADTVRRMHSGDETPRPVYGDATPDESAALKEEGIDVVAIPWVPRADG